jgi:hypothetical protein
MRPLHRFSIVLILVLLGASLAGCNAVRSAEAHPVYLAAMDAMPHAVQQAPAVVRNAYRFAAANAEVLQQLPCYCGCGGMGHMSNYHCFWQDSGQADSHALGCGICVDIAQDARRGLERGLSVAEIRAQVDADYSRFGPPTDTAPVVQ